jgi:flagellar motor switch protein FliG
VADGTDPYYFDKVLTNLVEQEKDEYTRTLKKIQKEAVMLIQQGMNAEMVHTVLNSLTDIPLSMDKTSTDSASPNIESICSAAEKQNKPFDFIRNCEPAEVLDILQREHPQTIAHVLSYLDSPQASVLLQFLPQELQGETARRIATMGKVSMEIIRGN